MLSGMNLMELIGSMSEEEAKEFFRMMGYPEEMAILAKELSTGEAQAAEAGPQGRQTSRLYVAANPLEHLGTALRRYQGQQRADAARERQQEITGARQRGLDILAGRAWQTGQPPAPAAAPPPGSAPAAPATPAGAALRGGPQTPPTPAPTPAQAYPAGAAGQGYGQAADEAFLQQPMGTPPASGPMGWNEVFGLTGQTNVPTDRNIGANLGMGDVLRAGAQGALNALPESGELVDPERRARREAQGEGWGWGDVLRSFLPSRLPPDSPLRR
jgi:hypothetical protein